MIVTKEFIENNVAKLPDLPGCWIFILNSLDKDGYGSIDSEQVHRVSYKLYNGEITPPLCVLHKCDNPICVNPQHLFLGTRGDNNKDRAIKHRSAKSITRNKYCKWGHERTIDNILSNGGCKTCHRLRAQRNRLVN